MKTITASILLHRVDLGVSHERGYRADIGGSSVMTSSIAPARLLSKIALFQHWTVEVRGICYEITEKEPEPTELLTNKPGHELYILPAEKWHRRRRKKGLKCQTRVLGLTNWDDSSIEGIAQHIWAKRFEKRWRLLRKNCQNFAALLNDIITLNEDEKSEILESYRKNWYRRLWYLTEHGVFWKSMLANATAATHVAIFAESADVSPLLQLGALAGAVFGVFQSLEIAECSKDAVFTRQAQEAQSLPQSTISSCGPENLRRFKHRRQARQPRANFTPSFQTNYESQANEKFAPVQPYGDYEPLTPMYSRSEPQRDRHQEPSNR